MNEKEAAIVLNMISGIGPVRGKKLLHAFSSFSNVLKAGVNDLKQIEGITFSLAQNISNWRKSVNLEKELQSIEEISCRILSLGTPEYPEELSTLYGPPLVLYIQGDLPKFKQPAIGIVGARQASYYGIKMTKKIAYQLAYQGITIISGLARGIDTAAHQGALAAEGITFSIIGSGLKDLYPKENTPLAKKIASHRGTIISEFPIHTPPDKRNFPRRNRLIAAWSDALLVTECAKNSGAMITANLANEMGKTVYALPGPVDQSHFQGCHSLIRDGAILVTSTEEILEDFSETVLTSSKYKISRIPIKSEKEEEELEDSQENSIIKILSSVPIHLDEIIEIVNIPTKEVISLLVALEMEKRVKRLPGQYFLKK